MKKKFLCAALMVSSICMNVFAAAGVSMVDNKVTVEIDSKAEKWGTVIVTKSGKSLDDENIVAINQALADENGKAIFNFLMPDTLEDGVNGKYDLHIKNGDETVYIDSMYYALPADRASVAGDLKDVTKNATDIKAVIEDESNEETLRALGVHLDMYNDFKDNTALTDSVCEAFAAARTENMSDTEVINLLNETVIIQSINTLPDKRVEVVEKLGFSFENIKYKNADDNTKAFVCDYIYANKPYASIENIQAAYEMANMLYVINNTRFDTMESVIAGYAQGLDIAREPIYSKYTNSSNKTAINKSIVTALKKKNAVTVQELLAVIDTATKKNSGNDSSGGGGGGINSETIDTSSNPIANIPVVNNENRGFSDIGDVTWAKTAILAMAERGIIAGDGKGNFNPNNSVKREEFVKMLVVAANMHKVDAKCTFGDVKDGEWYSSYVASAYNNNMVYGTSENSFGVGTNITRQDMAVMCYRAAKNANKLGKVRDSVRFADESEISEYAKDAVTVLYESGAINGIGDNLFDPAGTATRAQAAVIIYNLFVK